MHLPSIASVFILLAGLVSSSLVPDLPFDGLWITTDQGDGTIVTTSLSNPDFPPIVSEATAPTKSLKSRNVLAPRQKWADGDCYNEPLDHSGVDAAVEAWVSLVANGGYELCSGNGYTYALFNKEEMVVYYCIHAANRCGNLDEVDVRYALGQMDAHCPAYQASWFWWPNSVEIFGKAKSGDHIC
ncbi:hypothetical protein B0O99DRAFT_600360 [Bisporella sp. PMI_857]|nr:hypothetical protein B0O99DRAFT_600360 [Bisporella sp. PMI_857]